jgi:hypothetical protein
VKPATIWVMALFGGYFRRLLKQWFSLMSCAVFTFLGWYLAKYPQTPDWIYEANKILAIFFLFLAGFLVWRHEYKERLAVIAKDTRPNFQVDVSRIFHDATPVQGTPWLDCGNTYVAKLSIANLEEAPSTVREIYVTLDDFSSRFPAQPFGVAGLNWVKDGPVRSHASGQTYSEPKYQEETIRDILPLVCEPVTKGSHKDGWAYLSDLPSVDSSSLFKFYVVDAYGATHGPFVPQVELDHANVKRL